MSNYSKKFGYYSQSVGTMLALEAANSPSAATTPTKCSVCGKGYGYIDRHKRVDHSRCSKIKQQLHKKEHQK